METADGRVRVRERVQTEMSRIGWSNADLSRSAGIDNGTVGDFLAGVRWPTSITRAKIARALGWAPESIDAIERGGDPVLVDGEPVVPSSDDAGVLLSMPPGTLAGLDLAEREEVVTAAKLSALGKAREIRRRLDS